MLLENLDDILFLQVGLCRCAAYNINDTTLAVSIPCPAQLSSFFPGFGIKKVCCRIHPSRSHISYLLHEDSCAFPCSANNTPHPFMLFYVSSGASKSNLPKFCGILHLEYCRYSVEYCRSAWRTRVQFSSSRYNIRSKSGT